jgi:hypothetical protein
LAAGDVGSGREGLGPGGPVLIGSDVIAAEVEESNRRRRWQQ